MAPTQTREPKVKITRSPRQNPCFDEVLSNEVNLRMMQIPGGTFNMGAPENEPGSLDREKPQHEVNIETFFLGKYPVTQAQWRFIAKLAPLEMELPLNPSRFEGNNNPVERISWYEAIEFCQRLSRHSRRQYYLSSEAQWEYACRAGTTTPFHFGNTLTAELANYRGTDNEKYNWSGSYGSGPKGEYRETTTPVDYFEVANAFGLCDMHGNIWEWCADTWHDNYEGAPTDGSAWLDKIEESNRIIRGGSWDGNPRDCRSATRDLNWPEAHSYVVGFRVCCRVP